MATATLRSTSGARSPRHLEDWWRCINCKEFARNGAITHLRGCPDYVRTRSTRLVVMT